VLATCFVPSYVNGGLDINANLSELFSEPTEDSSEFAKQMYKLTVQIRAFVFEKKYDEALNALNEQEKLVKASDNSSESILLTNIVNMKAIIYDTQGKNEFALTQLANHEIKKFESFEFFYWYYCSLGYLALRCGDYEYAVKFLTKEIEKLSATFKLKKLSEEKNADEIQVINTCLAQCASFRLLAQFIVADGKINGDSFKDYLSQCFAFQKKLTEQQKTLLYASQMKFMNPLSDFLKDTNKKFRVVPQKTQPAIIQQSKNKEAPIITNITFLFDIVYENEVSKNVASLNVYGNGDYAFTLDGDSITFSTPNAETVKIEAQMHEYNAKVRELVFDKKYTEALPVLKKRDELIRGIEDNPLILSKFLVTTAAIYDVRGKNEDAVKLLSDINIEKFENFELCFYHYYMLGSLIMRSGDYEKSVKILTEEINKITEIIALKLKNEEENMEELQVLFSCLSQCAFFRLVAKFIVTEGQITDDSFYMDMALGLMIQKKLSEQQRTFVEAAQQKFWIPYTKLISDPSEKFRVVPLKSQPIAIKSGKTKEDPITIGISFGYDIVYKNEEKK
jgi:hypothetical protein